MELTKLKDLDQGPIQCNDTAILNNWKTVYDLSRNLFFTLELNIKDGGRNG
jgi:hypothetical protein